MRRFIAHAAVQSILSLTTLVAVGLASEVLGLSLGMNAAVVRDLFGKRGIDLVQIDAETLSASRVLAPLEKVAEVRLHFDKEVLQKVSVFFELPSGEPTANNLILLFEKEKERLKGLYGSPARDVAEMKAPELRERYEWLTRGRGYYQSLWQVGSQMTVTLWLYGEDSGIVLMETYERLEKH